MTKYMVVFPFFILLVVLFSPTNTHAASSPVIVTGSMPAVVPMQEPVEKIGVVMEKKQEYLLPFPGILPDHPLYFFKQVRDGILDRLIVDPLRKAEFHILQADKRLNMGVVLLEQKKETLAETTISKGEKYMERAALGLSAFKSTGRPVPASIIDKLTRSMEKHVEVLEKTNFTGTLALVKKLQSEIEKLK